MTSNPTPTGHHDNEHEVGDTDLFDTRDILAHIRDVARARRVGPWAVLGVVLAHAVAAVPPHVRLPAVIGGEASLNLFIGLVGPSGGGKGAAEGAARHAVAFTESNGMDSTVGTYPVGSGEGLARVYRPHGTNDDDMNPVTSAVFTAGEVDTLASLGGRTGSTLMSQLRHLYNGETLGFTNAGKDTRIRVEAHTYRAALIVGIQPLKAGPLLNDADGGTPQRFVWLPTSDPDAPDGRPDCPDTRTISLPRWSAGRTTIPIPERARHAIDAHRVAVLREHEGINPLDGHAHLCRLKVAAALMILDGRTRMNDDDWHLAGRIMAKSNATRRGIETELAERTRAANRERGRAADEREDAASDAKLTRAKTGVLRALDRKGDSIPVARNDVRRALKADIRDYFDPALAALVDEGTVVETRVPNGRHYQRAEGTRVPPVHPLYPQVREGVPEVHGVPPVAEGRTSENGFGPTKNTSLPAKVEERKDLPPFRPENDEKEGEGHAAVRDVHVSAPDTPPRTSTRRRTRKRRDANTPTDTPPNRGLNYLPEDDPRIDLSGPLPAQILDVLADGRRRSISEIVQRLSTPATEDEVRDKALDLYVTGQVEKLAGGLYAKRVAS